MLFGVGSSIYRKFFPKPPPAPTISFGQLPALPFPESQKPANLNYVLETPQGGLPKLVTQANVFFMPKISSNLLSLDLAKQKAADLDFNPNPQEVSETIYRFTHPKAPATLEMNIVTGIFSISFDLGQEPSILEKRPPAPEVATSQVKSFLSSANLFPEDLTGQTTHEFLKISEGKLTPALSLSESNFVKVNLFRKNYDELPSLTPNTNEANVWFIVSGAREREKQIVAGQFHYFPIDETQSSTYPLKTPDAAWQELITGGGFIANLGTNKEGDKITVRRVYLAYYDAGVPTEFYQPIIVFEGDNGFIAYVPAISPEQYGNGETTPTPSPTSTPEASPTPTASPEGE